METSLAFRSGWVAAVAAGNAENERPVGAPDDDGEAERAPRTAQEEQTPAMPESPMAREGGDESAFRMEQIENHLLLMQDQVLKRFNEIQKAQRDAGASLDKVRVQNMTQAQDAKSQHEDLERRVRSLETELAEANGRIARLEASATQSCFGGLFAWLRGPPAVHTGFERSDDDGAFGESASPFADIAAADDGLRTPLRAGR